MSDWGRINARFIFVEGFEKSCAWEDVLNDIVDLRNKVFEAADAHINFMKKHKQEFDKSITDGELTLSDGHKVKYRMFMMGERDDNFSRDYIPHILCNRPWYKAIPYICKKWKCVVDVWMCSEYSLGKWSRSVYGPDGEKWWDSEEDTYDLAYITNNPKWEDVIAEHYCKYMIESDLQVFG